MAEEGAGKRQLPAALEPFKWKPGQSGNPSGRPKWLRQIEEVVRSGRELFEKQYRLANAQCVDVIDVNGRPYKEKVKVKDGRTKSGYRTVDRAVKIVPNAAIMLQAQQLLLDRAFGRASQAITIDPGGEVAAAILADLTPEEHDTVLLIAHRRLLRDGPQGAQGSMPTRQAETIDVTPDPDDPEGGSASTGDPRDPEG